MVLVSVLMSAYNSEAYLAEAIESVLNQTFTDFEFIIIDDGSKDSTLSIIQKYQAKDARIVVDSHENMGLGNSLNRAIKTAKGAWIARMDADDIMLPNRLEEQVKYLQAHPTVDVLSCWAYYINHQGRTIGKLSHPTDLQTKEDNKRYFTENKLVHILHPGVMMRKDAVLNLGGYKPIVPSQDIELWNRLIEHGYYFVCTHQILMKYRIHSKSVTNSNYMKAILFDEWIGECMKLRRQGKPEITFETYQKGQKARPMLLRIDSWRKMYANYAYRKAAFLLGNRNYVGFLWNVICSFLLAPTKMLGRVSRQL
jgi:glycosyltransferase involved in cell wall biosynthesis